MSQDVLEDILEVLNKTFDKCDVDDTGLVDINTLITNLTSQDPTWHGDERIEEEVRNLLLCDESTLLISKDHFVNSLLQYFESTYCQDNEAITNTEVLCSEDTVDKCSCSSSGVGDSLEIISSSSRNSIGGNAPQEHLDGDNLLSDGISVTDSESPRKDTKVIESLEKELNSLQRKQESLESANSSLLTQVSTLEEVIAKEKKESATYCKKLTDSNQLASVYKQKQQEAEEKLYVFIEESKYETKKLLQSSRENAKLKSSIVQLEKQVDVITVKQKQKDAKITALQEKLKQSCDLQIKSQEELESLKVQEKTLLDELETVKEQNSNLQCQLESSITLLQDIKCELNTAYRELSSMQNTKIMNRLHGENLPDDLSDDNSLVFFDGDFILDNTIPYETSLLAEIQDTSLEKDKPTPRKCCCICMKNISFSSSSSISVGTDNYPTKDVAVGTVKAELTDQATMTTLPDLSEFRASKHVNCRDVGVNCSLKNIVEEKTLELNCKLCHLKSKRSVTKWMILGSILLLLCFLLGFLSALATLSYVFKHSSNGCLSSFLDLFQISIKYPNLHKPI